MSILIKGMEMPKDCPMCPLAHWDVAGTFTGCNIVCGKKYAMSDREYANRDTRPDWCPLVPVPPHGRVIDADALLNKHFGKMYFEKVVTATKEEMDIALTNIPLVINNAPTIIPAEEGET